jgi:subtilisin
MKKSFLTLIITFLAIIIILLSGTAYSEEPRRDVIIGFHQMPIPSEKALIHSEGGVVKHEYRLIPAVSASLSEQAIDIMRKNPRVAYIEDDAILTIATDEYVNSSGVSHIGCEMAHNNGIDGTGVKVAVIDTGMDYTHEDLNDNYKGGYDFVFNDFDPFDGNNSHGTHVAGIIAAERNGIGVVGVAPNASLYAVRVLDSAGFGNVSWVIAGIEWAVDNDMDVAIMSSGTKEDYQSLREACRNASDAGVLLVAAAGNTDGGNVTYPARYDSVIAVTATDLNDSQASFSPIGPEVELAAPGVNILSTVVGDSSYGNLSGTSQAAPHVAGTAALIISSNLPDVNDDGVVNNEDVRLQLQSTAQDLGDPGKDDTYGYGLVKALITAAAISCDCGDICVSTSGWWRDGGAFNASGAPIQDAVDNASSGDTICVAAGSYTENVDVATDHLTIQSENGSVSTIVQAANSGNHVFEVIANYVNISGFNVAGATGTSQVGIYLNGADHCNISDNTASGNWGAIYLKFSNNNILLNNTASNNDNYGISLYDSSDNLIYNNYLNNTRNVCDDGSNRWNTTVTTGSNIIGGLLIGGNYWSDYTDADTDGDGLGDSEYPIAGGSNFDYHPLCPPEASVKGDLNGDDDLTPADATIALCLAATGAHDDAADVSGDGQVTSLDALMILQAVAEMAEL